MKPLVSVVIPCFNYGRFLEECVDSVIAQTYPNIEIIIADDASTDNTEQVVENLKRLKDTSIKYVRQAANVRQSANRNAGIAHASGEFIALLDADDKWCSTYLEKTMKCFVNDKIGVAYALKKTFDGKRSDTLGQYCFPIICIDDLFVKNFIGTPIVVRTEAFREVGGYDTSLLPEMGNLGADWWVLLNLIKNWTIVCIGEHLYQYRMHDSQISNNILRRIDSDKAIRARFLSENPGLLSPKTIRKSAHWAALCEGFYSKIAKNRKRSIKSYMNAIRCKPTDLAAYKALGLTLLGR